MPRNDVEAGLYPLRLLPNHFSFSNFEGDKPISTLIGQKMNLRR